MTTTAAAPITLPDAPDAYEVARRLEASQHDLRRLLRRSATGKEAAWASDVADELGQLRELLALHRSEVRGPHCHYEELCLSAQWLIPRLQQLIGAFDRVEFGAALLGQQLAVVIAGDAGHVGPARAEALQLLSNLRRALSEENAVEMDRFNEPPAID